MASKVTFSAVVYTIVVFNTHPINRMSKAATAIVNTISSYMNIVHPTSASLTLSISLTGKSLHKYLPSTDLRLFRPVTCSFYRVDDFDLIRRKLYLNDTTDVCMKPGFMHTSYSIQEKFFSVECELLKFGATTNPLINCIVILAD